LNSAWIKIFSSFKPHPLPAPWLRQAGLTPSPFGEGERLLAQDFSRGLFNLMTYKTVLTVSKFC